MTNLVHGTTQAESIEYGNPDKFPALQDVLQYRSLTMLLSLTNFVDQQPSGESNYGGIQRDYTDTTGNPPHIKMKKSKYRKLAACIDVLCRHFEVIALTLGPNNIIRGIVEGDDDDQALEQTIIYTNNPDDNDGDKPKRGTSVPGTCQPLLPSIPSCHNNITKSPGTLLLRKTIGLKLGRGKEKMPKTSYSLGEHGDMFLQLLRQTYASEDPKQKRDNNSRLEAYVFVNSGAKIFGRLKKGNEGTRKFLQVMSLPPELIREFLAHHPNSTAIVSHHASNEPFNAKERRTIEELLRALKETGIDTSPLQEWQTALSLDAPIAYDSTGIFQFQALLRLILTTIDSDIRALQKCKQKNQMKRGKDAELRQDTPAIKTLGKEIDSAALKAAAGMRLLAMLKEQYRLRDVLKRHLRWLGRLFKEGVTKDDFGGPVAVTPRTLDVAIQEAYTDPPASSEPSDIGQEHTMLGSVIDSRSSVSESKPFRVTSTDETRDSARAEGIYKSDYDGIDAQIAQGQWHLGAMKFLDLICLHTCSILSLARGVSKSLDIEIREFVRTAKFEWVRHMQQEVDHSLTPLSEVLAVMTKEEENGDETPLTLEDVEHIKLVVECRNHRVFKNEADKKAIWNGNDRFGGNVHCESLVMSYADLRKVRNSVVLCPEEMCRKQDHLQLPERAVADQFAPIIDYLPVTKRCCPACHAYIQYMVKKQGREILYPGDHPMWSATTIPPWMLKDAAEEVMGHAKRELQRRLGEILTRAEFASPATRSTGSEPGSTILPETTTFYSTLDHYVTNTDDWSDDTDEEELPGAAPISSSPPGALPPAPPTYPSPAGASEGSSADVGMGSSPLAYRSAPSKNFASMGEVAHGAEPSASGQQRVAGLPGSSFKRDDRGASMPTDEPGAKKDRKM